MPVSYFADDAVIAIRGPEVPAASFDDGMNIGGSCSPGIGIGFNYPNLDGLPQAFTLLDQRALARTPQQGQAIGGEALGDGQAGFLPGNPVRFGNASVSGDGVVTNLGDATLSTLAGGWVAV